MKGSPFNRNVPFPMVKLPPLFLAAIDVAGIVNMAIDKHKMEINLDSFMFVIVCNRCFRVIISFAKVMKKYEFPRYF